ncbi:DNA topology modulation protein FlaR [Paenibacillus sp. OAS669]|uniref:DNA topology modulation protein FlaR n=1 Tax=Paenibacillus sp. OAS669 TaxID=2663821 RepID=UPI00178A4A2A|nr:DNA topology modulation protein FlaR [Paenibacillus sp. OAS669]MBE1442724.1 adenylate kinase family enzyme [Paenibacillus sp. OAS669]
MKLGIVRLSKTTHNCPIMVESYHTTKEGIGIKIHIIGGAGSGKSYISALLSQKLQIPYYELDEIYWDNEAEVYGVKALAEERDQKLRDMVAQDSWIIEGAYRSWVAPSFSAADKIVVLMPPLSVQEARIWKRYEERISGAVISKKRETLEGTLNLIEWNKEYNLVKLPHFIETCEYKDKFITVKDNLDVLELFTN